MNSVQSMKSEKFHGMPMSIRREYLDRIMERKCWPCLAKTDRDGNLVMDAILPPKMGRMARLLAFCSMCLMKGAVLINVEDQKGEE